MLEATLGGPWVDRRALWLVLRHIVLFARFKGLSRVPIQARRRKHVESARYRCLCAPLLAPAL